MSASMTLTPTTRGNTQYPTRDRCRRCSGYMAHEMCTDLESDSGQSTFWVHRCIQCGDMVDEVILRNRSLSNPGTVLVARNMNMIEKRTTVRALHESTLSGR